MNVPLPRSVVAEDRVAWSMYFAGIVSFQLHPGYKDPIDLPACAELADRMLALYMRRFPWDGLVPP